MASNFIILCYLRLLAWKEDIFADASSARFIRARSPAQRPRGLPGSRSADLSQVGTGAQLLTILTWTVPAGRLQRRLPSSIQYVVEQSRGRGLKTYVSSVPHRILGLFCPPQSYFPLTSPSVLFSLSPPSGRYDALTLPHFSPCFTFHLLSGCCSLNTSST